MPQVGSYRVRIKPGLASNRASSGSSSNAVAVNDVTRRHEVLGPFIDLGTKAANQVFVDVTHHPIRHHVRVQVDLGKVLANLVQQARFLQPDHRIAKLKLLEDSAGVIRKQGDVVFQIAARLGATGVPREYSEVL